MTNNDSAVDIIFTHCNCIVVLRLSFFMLCLRTVYCSFTLDISKKYSEQPILLWFVPILGKNMGIQNYVIVRMISNGPSFRICYFAANFETNSRKNSGTDSREGILASHTVILPDSKYEKSRWFSRFWVEFCFTFCSDKLMTFQLWFISYSQK